MLSSYPLMVGLRYAGSQQRNQLVAFISRVSMLGMTVGVALLIVVLSVMNGFDREMRTRILGLVPHINVLSYQPGTVQDWQAIEQLINQHPEVRATAPFAQLNAMLLKGSSVEGIVAYGIDPNREGDVSILRDYLSEAEMESLADQSGSLSRNIVIGTALAKKVRVGTGDSLNVMVPAENKQGQIQPRFIRMQISAVFATGTELDQAVAFVSLGQALSLMPADQRQQGLRIAISDISAAPRVAWELSQNLPYGFTTRDWTRTHGNLYAAIQLSKQLVGLMLLTIIAVAAFNVVSALVMIVTDKRGDIAILRTAGASPGGIMAIFMIQGTMIAVIGTLAGCVIGAALALGVTDIIALIERLFSVQFLNSDVYPIDYVPSDLRWQDVGLVCTTAFALSILATVYPAWRASRVQPAEALRYE